MFKGILTFLALVCCLGTSAVAGFDMVTTSDGTCQFFYPTNKNTSGWYIEPSSKDMCQNGFVNKHGQITVYNAFGKPIEQIYGFFNGGYWTGDKELSAQVISGYAENKDTYKVSFELPSDTGFDVRYLSQMVTKKQKDASFGAFSFCNPFRILVQTEDYGLFQDKSLTTEIIDDVAKYAKILCPAEHKIQLFGSPKERPTQTDVFFYADIDLKTAQIDVKRNETEHFKKQKEMLSSTPDNVSVLSLTDIEQADLSPIHVVSEVVSGENPTTEVKTEDIKTDIARLTDKVPHLLTISRLTGKPVQGTVIVEIKRVSGKTAEVVSPCSLHLTGENLISGWAIISGTFSHKSGRKAVELNGNVDVSSIISCMEPYCTDVN